MQHHPAARPRWLQRPTDDWARMPCMCVAIFFLLQAAVFWWLSNMVVVVVVVVEARQCCFTHPAVCQSFCAPRFLLAWMLDVVVDVDSGALLGGVVRQA